MKSALPLRSFVVVATVLIGALVVGSAGAGAKSAVVPWVDKSATSALLLSLEPKPLPVTPPKTDAPPCASSALSLEPAVGLQMMQDDGVAVRFRNTGRAACLVRGRPFVVATAPGHPSVVASKLGLAATGGEIADTPVGGTVSVDISAPITCTANPGGSEQGLPVYHSLVMTLPGGAERIVTGLNLSITCGLAVTPFSSPRPAPSYAPYWLASLRPRVDLPISVKAGHTLVYKVTLRNPLNRPVSLSPCPAYIEHASSDIKLEYQFNCSDVRSIPAHGSAVFQMKMAVPESTPIGPMTLYWSVIGPNTLEARAMVDVR